MNKPFEDAWRSHYDAWKTDAPDPGRVERSHPGRYRCLECDWRGHNLATRYEHYWQTGGHRIIEERQS